MLKRTKFISKLLLGVLIFSILSTPEIVLPDSSSTINSKESSIQSENDEMDAEDSPIILQIKEGTNLTEIVSLFPEDIETKVFENTRTISVEPEAMEQVESVLSGSSAERNIEALYEDETAYLHKVPSDPYYASFQWNLRKIGMEEAWDYPLTNEDVVVAVIDTGVTAYNDMYGLLNGADFSTGVLREDTFPGQYSYDGGNHGTAVASVIASEHNQIAIAGINPKTKIMGVKVFPDGSDTTTMNVVSSGIRWATDHGADIINLSLGSANSTTTLREAVQYAADQGVAVIASTGNDGYLDSIRYPAAYESVIAVGSTDEYDEVSYFSNQGSQIDLVAPGQGIVLPDIRQPDSYRSFSGTSFSAPMVSGVASMLLDAYPEFSPLTLREILKESSRDLGISGWDAASGHGIIDASNAMEVARKSRYIDWNDSIMNAERIYANETYERYIMPEGDLDYYVFTLLEPYALEISLKSSMGLDLTAAVYDQSGNVMAKAAASGDGSDKIMEGFLEAGTYHIEIQDAHGRESLDFYEILIWADDSVSPSTTIENIYDEVIPYDGLSRYDTTITAEDSSSYTWDVVKDGRPMGNISYLTEEGNYEVLTADILGNKTRDRFVIDRDGMLRVAYHTGTDEVLSDQEIPYETRLELPELTREHYRLIGWYTDSAFEEAFISGSEVRRNLELYAKWERTGFVSVELISAPHKTSYFTGEPLDLTGLALRGYFEDGQWESIDQELIEVTGYNSEKPVSDQVVTVKVDGHFVTFKVEIKEVQLESIRILSNPMKTEYVVGQSLELEGLSVSGFYSNGEERQLKIDIGNISGFSSKLPQVKQVVTVTVEGRSDDFMVNIVERALISVKLASPPDTLQYIVGQNLRLEGISITGTYNDGQEEDLSLSELQVSGFDSSLPVERQVIAVTIQGKTVTFLVEIIEKVLDSVLLRALPKKLVYEVGESLELSGIELTGVYNDGEEKILDVQMDHIVGFDSSTPMKDQTVMIRFGSFTASFLVDIVSKPSLDVLAGIHRFSTATAVSQASYSTSETAILVQAFNFPDALSAGPLAYALKAPILLTGTESLNMDTEEELRRLGVKKVIILGGAAAVSVQVENILRKDYQVERIAGATRFGTAVETARYLKPFGRNENTVVLASGFSYADALSMGSYASRNALPILLTGEDALTDETLEYLRMENVKHVIVVGGTSVIDEELVKDLQLRGLSVERVSGVDRFSTSVAIGETFFGGSKETVVVNGMDYADALTAAPFAAERNASILLVQENRIRDGVISYLSESDIRRIFVIGGEKVVGLDVRKQLLGLMENR